MKCGVGGSIIPDYFDTTKIKIENHAIGGEAVVLLLLTVDGMFY
jgi:hypothetical protein